MHAGPEYVKLTGNSSVQSWGSELKPVTIVGGASPRPRGTKCKPVCTAHPQLMTNTFSLDKNRH